MSDMESFAWKLSSILFGLFGIVIGFLYFQQSTFDAKVVYVEPDTVYETDTVVVHDTVYKLKAIVKVDAVSNTSSDTEMVEQ